MATEGELVIGAEIEDIGPLRVRRAALPGVPTLAMEIRAAEGEVMPRGAAENPRDEANAAFIGQVLSWRVDWPRPCVERLSRVGFRLRHALDTDSCAGPGRKAWE